MAFNFRGRRFRWLPYSLGNTDSVIQSSAIVCVRGSQTFTLRCAPLYPANGQPIRLSLDKEKVAVKRRFYLL